ncbi:cuticle-degrading protease [Fusarium denticulatum]|uniref:Cuticle-degrading protease n=1 Tax=Fusarium denticulatum TaxID=48507 RepID=A0A8H5TTY9_9HYPO|nr:cuticle-degrading protease [Fusarium denticulatum]
MKPVESKDLEKLVKLNSILIFDIDCWGASYLRNILSHGPSHITTKQGNKTLPTELWLGILDLTKLHVDENTYKLVYGIEITHKSANGDMIEPTLICNVLDERKGCKELRDGYGVWLFEKCLRDPSFKDVRGRQDKKRFPFLRITKSARENTFSIPVSHLRFQEDFLFHKIEVPDIIARLEDGDCHLCGGDRSLDLCRSDDRANAGFYYEGVFSHRWCYHSTICALCLGRDYARDHLNIMFGKCMGAHSDNEEEEEDTEEEKMEKNSFRKRLNRRYQELGYAWRGS